MNTIEEINSLLPDNNTRDIEPKHIREAFAKINQILTTDLALKLQKPIATLTAPDTEFQYVPILNEANETRRMLAGDLGKNLGNTDLKIPENTVRVLDTTNAKLQIKGLENKKSDASYNLRVKTNALGELAFTDEADVSINIPDTITTTATPAHSTITVNHIYPNEVPQLPQYVEEIRNIMANYRSIDFTPIKRQDFRMKSAREDITLENVVQENGHFNLPNISEKLPSENGIELVSNIVFPADKDWVIEFNGRTTMYDWVATTFLGLGKKDDNAIFYGLHRIHQNSISILNVGKGVSGDYFKVIFLKTGNLITILLYGQGGACHQQTYPLNTEMGAYEVVVSIDNKTSINGNLKYKMLS